jgi:hypothetical protein
MIEMQEGIEMLSTTVNRDVNLQPGDVINANENPSNSKPSSSYWKTLGFDITSLLASICLMLFNISILWRYIILVANLIVFTILLFWRWITPFFHGYSLGELNRGEPTWKKAVSSVLKKRLPDALLACSLMLSICVSTFSAFAFFRTSYGIFWGRDVILVTTLCPIYCLPCIAFVMFLKNSADGKYTIGALISAILEVALALCIGVLFVKYYLDIGFARRILGAVFMVVAVAVGIPAAHSMERGCGRWMAMALKIFMIINIYLDLTISMTGHRTDITEPLEFNISECPLNILLNQSEYNYTELPPWTNGGRVSSGENRCSQGPEIVPRRLIEEKFKPVTYTNSSEDFGWFIMKESWILRMWIYVGLDFEDPRLNFDWIMILGVVQSGHIQVEGDVSIEHFDSWWSGLKDLVNRTEEQWQEYGDYSWSLAAGDVMELIKTWAEDIESAELIYEKHGKHDSRMYLATEFNILAYDLQVLIWNTLGAAESKLEVSPCYEPIRGRIRVVMNYAKKLTILEYLGDGYFWKETVAELLEEINYCLNAKDCRACQEHNDELKEGKRRLAAWQDMKDHPINDLHDILLGPGFDFVDETMAWDMTTEQTETDACSDFTILASITQTARTTIKRWKEVGQGNIGTIIAKMDKEMETLVSDIKRLSVEPSNTSPCRAYCGAVDISVFEGYVALYDKNTRPSSWNGSSPIELREEVERFAISNAKLLEAINYFTLFDDVLLGKRSS